MSLQKVNTEAIAATAAQISAADSAMNQAFESVVSQKSSLEGAWNSPAGETAAVILNQLLQGSEARSAVMHNFAAVLQQVVSPGYDQGETHNAKLADLFR